MNFIFIKNKKSFLLLLLFPVSCFLFFLSSCAKIGYPSGGKKDDAPPQVVKTNPANKNTNFTSKNITISFNEFIQLSDAANQVLISPALSQTPKIKLKKKNIVITISETLRANTTYTINFGNAIKDIHEGNTMEDFKYVFSTGEFLDSFKISGKVFFANNRKTEKGIFVMLYENTDDSVVMKEKPVYYAKTNESGNFKIENIKGGTYKLFALKDQNFNMLYDLPNEQIAFLDSNIVVDSVERSYELAMFQEKSPKQKLLNVSSKEYGKVNFVFSKPIGNNQIEIVSSNKKPQHTLFEFSKNKDSVTYWLSDLYMDSLTFFIWSNNLLYDSVVQLNLIKEEDSIIDTVRVKLHSLPKDSVLNKKLRTIFPASRRGEKTFTINQNLHEKFRLEFEHPVVEMNDDKIIILEDSQPTNGKRKVYAFDDLHNGHRKFSLEYENQWKENTPYKLIFPDSTFKDIFGLYNDSMIFNFKTKLLADYGNLDIKSNASVKNVLDYYLELLDEKESVLKQDWFGGINNFRISFKALPPSKYLLRITRDENHNQKWDTGNYLQKLQPEKVIYYKEPINLRANWDMEVEISVE